MSGDSTRGQAPEAAQESRAPPRVRIAGGRSATSAEDLPTQRAPGGERAEPDATARYLAAASWLLRAAILIHAIGLVVVVFTNRPTAFGNLLFLEWEIDYARSVMIEKTTASVFLTLAVAAFVRPHWALLLPMALYIALEAGTRAMLGGEHFSGWALGAYALRYLTPVALLLLVTTFSGRPSAINRVKMATWTLRIGIATVFLFHGLEAWLGHPRFVDLILGSTNNLLGIRLQEATAVSMLRAIGVVDLMVAAAVLVRPVRPVLAWTAIWGAITAFSRMTTLGSGAFTEVLDRASHMLAPLAAMGLVMAIAAVEASRTKTGSPRGESA